MNHLKPSFDDWLLFRDLAEAFVDRFAARRGTARTVDEEKQGRDVVGIGDLFQHLELITIFRNRPLDRHPRDLLLARDRGELVTL